MDNAENCCTCGERKTVRGDEELKDLMNRLKRIEGQVRGLQGMLEKDAYCADILIQTSAVISALSGFSKKLLASHLRTCVARDIANGRDGAVDELIALLDRMY